MRKTIQIKNFRYLLARLQKKLLLRAVADSEVDASAAIEAGSQIVNSKIGKHSFCGYNCVISNTEIGKFCSIADEVYIGGSNHPMEYVSTSPVFLSHRDSVKMKYAKFDHLDLPRTRIGHDVWIGHGVHIRAGVDIGTGAVIGMGAVVARDVAPYSIVVGNPAREIRKRFREEIVEQLLNSAWWDYSDQELMKAAVHFNDPSKYLSSLENK